MDTTHDLEAMVSAIMRENPDPAVLLAMRDEIATETWIAAIAGDADALGRLIASDPESVTHPAGPRDWVPLLYACHSRLNGIDECQTGLAECAQLLLSHGADPDAHYIDPSYPDSPQSALYGATGVNCNPLLADVLLRHGANTQDGESIYHAAQLGHFVCLEVLAKHGADFSAAQQPWGNTPLYFLLGHRRSDPQWPVALTGIRWLLEQGGADPNVVSTDAEEVPLHLAAMRHDAEVTALLLEHGGHADAPTRDGLTPYAIAVRHWNADVMKLLANNGGTTQLKALDVLLGACAAGDRTEAEKLLAQHGNLRESLGSREHGTLCELAAENRLDAVRTYCELGLPLDNFGPQHSSPLHQACWYGYEDVAAVLVDHGAALDTRDGDYQGYPIDWVCHGSLFRKQATPDVYAAIATKLIRHGSPLPDADWGSPEAQAVLKAARG